MTKPPDKGGRALARPAVVIRLADRLILKCLRTKGPMGHGLKPGGRGENNVGYAERISAEPARENPNCDEMLRAICARASRKD